MRPKELQPLTLLNLYEAEYRFRTVKAGKNSNESPSKSKFILKWLQNVQPMPKNESGISTPLPINSSEDYYEPLPHAEESKYASVAPILWNQKKHKAQVFTPSHINLDSNPIPTSFLPSLPVINATTTVRPANTAAAVKIDKDNRENYVAADLQKNIHKEEKEIAALRLRIRNRMVQLHYDLNKHSDK